MHFRLRVFAVECKISLEICGASVVDKKHVIITLIKRHHVWNHDNLKHNDKVNTANDKRFFCLKSGFNSTY